MFVSATSVCVHAAAEEAGCRSNTDNTDNYTTRGAAVVEVVALGSHGGGLEDHLLDHPTMCASFLAGKDGSSASEEEEEEEAGGKWWWGGSRPRLSIRLQDTRRC